MLEIMFSWLSIPRTIGIWIDSIAYGLIDNIYNLIDVLASGTLFEENTILTIMNNTYIVISIFALFRIALILVNAMINPDKLNDKENGIGSVLRNLVIMFVLLIFTPMLFREAYYIQKTVVDNHYISKIFNGKVESSDNPGKTMQRIALQALIHPDTDVHTPGGTVPEIANFQGGKYVPGSECGGDCEEAINDYNANILNGDQDLWSTFTKHIGKTEKVDGETVYVYTYTFLVTFAVGVFITYVLASMAIDISVRSVELAVLQIISPLFIVTFIDPKSAKSGPFHNWLKTVGKTYASLFIKLGVLELMIMFVSLIPKITLFDDKSGLKFWGTLVVLLAILIFAKKAPKWIGEMIGVDGENSGIGGLGKKLGSAALVGGALTKAGHAAAGAVSGGVRALHNDAKNRRAKRKQVRKDTGLTHLKAGHDTRKNYDGGYFSQRRQLHQARKQAYEAGKVGAKNNLARVGASAAMGTILGAQAGFKADNLKGTFTAGVKAADNFADRMAMENHSGIFDRIGGRIKRLPGIMEKAYGTSNELFDARENQAKQKKAFEWTKQGDFGTQGVGIGQGKVVVGQKDVNSVCDAIAKNKSTMGDLNYDSFAAAQYALNRGYASVDASGNIDLSKVKINAENRKFEFTGANGTVKEISFDDLEKNVGGIMDSSSIGMVSQEKMITTYKTTTLNNYQQNEQTRAQEITSYQTARSESEKMQQQIQQMQTSLSAALTSLNLTFDPSDIESSIKDGISQIDERLKKIGTDQSEDAKKERQELEELKQNMTRYQEEIPKAIDAKMNFDNVADSSLHNIEIINAAQKEMRPVVESVNGPTISAKLNTLSIEEKKQSDKIAGMTPKTDENK